MGPILFTHNKNIAHVMPRVTARAVMSCTRHAAHARRQAGRPNYPLIVQPLAPYMVLVRHIFTTL